MKILSAMGIKVCVPIKVHLHASNVLKSNKWTEERSPDFEMYVMLSAWIDVRMHGPVKNLITMRKSERNEVEIATAAALKANEYPDIVKYYCSGQRSYGEMV